MFKNVFCFGVACLCLQSVIGDEDFQHHCVYVHNKYREMHDVPDLVSDTQMANFAQQWADKLASSGRLSHRPKNKFGENLYARFGRSNITCDEAVKAWYDEIEHYNFNSPGFSSTTGHFTQIVWRETITIGCAITIRNATFRNDEMAFIVCNYDPPGNFIGEFEGNVFPKLPSF